MSPHWSVGQSARRGPIATNSPYRSFPDFIDCLPYTRDSISHCARGCQTDIQCFGRITPRFHSRPSSLQCEKGTLCNDERKTCISFYFDHLLMVKKMTTDSQTFSKEKERWTYQIESRSSQLLRCPTQEACLNIQDQTSSHGMYQPALQGSAFHAAPSPPIVDGGAARISSISTSFVYSTVCTRADTLLRRRTKGLEYGGAAFPLR